MNIRQTVRNFMNTELKEEGFHEGIRDDDSLIDLGILDSLSFLKLLDFLDEKFGISPSEGELIPENLDSLITICNLIEKNS